MQSEELAPPTRTKKVRRFATRKSLVAAGIIVVSLACAVAAAMFWFRSPPPIVPNSVAEKVLFPVYAPAYLPAGYTIDTKSFSTDNTAVLIFQATNTAGANIAITEEATPSAFDFNSFYTANLSNITNLVGLPYVTVAGVLKSNSRTILSVNTGKTWIIMTSQARFSQAVLRDMSQRLSLQT